MGGSHASRTSGSANPVHVVFIILWHIVIKNCFYIIHVNASCGNIRCYQNIRFSVAERLHDTVTLLLLKIAVQPFRKITTQLQLGNQLIHLLFGVAKNKRTLRVIQIKQSGKHLRLIFLTYLIVVLLNLRDRKLLLYHTDKLRIPLILLRQFENRLWHRCGKQKCLAFPRKLR